MTSPPFIAAVAAGSSATTASSADQQTATAPESEAPTSTASTTTTATASTNPPVKSTKRLESYKRYQERKNAYELQHPNTKTAAADGTSLSSHHAAYRDRAKERLEGKQNIDYAESEQYATAASDEPKLNNKQEFTYEESKYLGGDAQHTHLVRGLDTKLLEKTRLELQQQQSNDGTQLNDRSIHTTAAATVQPVILSALSQQLRQYVKQQQRNASLATINAAALLSESKETLFSSNRLSYRFECMPLFGLRSTNILASSRSVPIQVIASELESEQASRLDAASSSNQMSDSDDERQDASASHQQSVRNNKSNRSLQRGFTVPLMSSAMMQRFADVLSGKRVRTHKSPPLVASASNNSPLHSSLAGAAQQSTSQAASAAVASDDDDIFNDAGCDYQVTTQNEEDEDLMMQPSTTQQPLFASEPPIAIQSAAQSVLRSQIGSPRATAKQDPGHRQSPIGVKPQPAASSRSHGLRTSDAMTDSYAECYPTYDHSASAAADDGVPLSDDSDAEQQDWRHAAGKEGDNEGVDQSKSTDAKGAKKPKQKTADQLRQEKLDKEHRMLQFHMKRKGLSMEADESTAPATKAQEAEAKRRRILHGF